ncbi:MAG: GTPase [Geobacter sp.]|nr:MAG: GTPase [Geobacter sp.]
MSFKITLKTIVESVEGGVGAIIMGYDGIEIDAYGLEDSALDVQLLAVEYATVLKEVKKTVEVLKSGDMEEVTIATSLYRVLVRAINDEFFVVLVLLSDGNYGKGRYLLKRETPALLAGLQ